jgi:hypothetical protein
MKVMGNDSHDRLRRLTIKKSGFSRRFTGRTLFRSDQVHPIQFILEPRDGPVLLVVLHTSSLGSLTRDEAAAIALLADLPKDHYEVLRTQGPAGEPLAGIPVIEMGDEMDGLVPVVVRTDDRERHTAIPFAHQWKEIAKGLGRNRAAGDLLTFQAAAALHAHVFVSKSKHLEFVRERAPNLTENLVSPLEALPPIWALCRGFGDHWDDHIVTSSRAYYWAVARALTPNAYPGFASLVRGEDTFANGSELVSLGQSSLQRIAGLIGTLDQMLRVWHVPANNHTIDEMCELFDHVVLGASAALDSIALLAAKYFGIQIRQNRIALHNDDFLAEVQRHQDPRATAFARFVHERHHAVSVHVELRHHAVHRAGLQGIRFSRGSEPEEMRVWVREPTLGTVWDHLEAIGARPTEWGFSDRQGPHDITVSFTDQPGRTAIRPNPGQALLDPMRFAPRLVAAVADIVDGAFGALDFPSDARFATEDQAWIRDSRSQEWPFRPADVQHLLLTSPLSGLVQT